MTTHQSRCEELATELERLNARANPGDGTDWLSACEDLGEFYAANTREIIALLRSLASQPAIPADASELAEAARACLALLESIEDKTLIGDEGCLWPVERLRVALSAQPAGGAVGEAKRQALNTCVEWVRSRKYAFTADEMLKEVSALLISDPAKEH